MAVKLTVDAGSTLPEIERNVSERVAPLAQWTSPFLAAIGFPNRIEQVGSTKHEHLEDTLTAHKATVNAAATSSATSIVLNTGHGARFNRAGMVIQMDGSDELMSLDSVPGADTLTVTRAILGSTGEAVLASATARILFTPPVESESSFTPFSQNRTQVNNWLQIFRSKASVTEDEASVTKIGIPNELRYQESQRIKELLREIAYATFRGRAHATTPQGSASIARTMNGIIPLILTGSDPSTHNAADGVLTQNMIDTVLNDMHSKGGKPDVIVVNQAQKLKLNNLMEGRVRFGVEDNVLGCVVDEYQSPVGGLLKVLPADEFCPVDMLLIASMALIQPVMLGKADPARGQRMDGPFIIKPIGDTGLAAEELIYTRYSCEFRNAGNGGHGIVRNLSTA